MVPPTTPLEPGGARDAVLDALVAVIAERGLEGTSVRVVAARAGVSIGAVQHHFPTKDAMLAAAMQRVEQVHRDRLAREAAALADGSAAARLRVAVASLVPATDDERPATALWLAFVARAAVHPGTAGEHRRTWQRAEDGLAGLVAACEDGAAAGAGPGARARDAAAELLALADGLAVSVLLEPERMSPGRARALLDSAVDGVLARLDLPGS